MQRDYFGGRPQQNGNFRGGGNGGPYRQESGSNDYYRGGGNNGQNGGQQGYSQRPSGSGVPYQQSRGPSYGNNGRGAPQMNGNYARGNINQNNVPTYNGRGHGNQYNGPANVQSQRQGPAQHQNRPSGPAATEFNVIGARQEDKDAGKDCVCICPYNATHMLYKSNINAHLERCPDKELAQKVFDAYPHPNR